jgi:hypothetical protein
MQAHTNLYLLMLNTAPAGSSLKISQRTRHNVTRHRYFTYTSHRSA